MTFLSDNFLLHNDTARYLYHEIAQSQPIFDYHCHLSPQVIADNTAFSDLHAAWLVGDHYKWRALRTLGVEERLITGDASSREKFQTYAACVPQFIGNPLYHWTHLELKRPFGISTLLNHETADTVWQRCGELLQQPAFSPRGILQQMNVRMVGTTDDPCDDLRHHTTIAADTEFDIAVLPSFRPDKALNIHHQGFSDYLSALSAASNTDIHDFDSLCDALSQRLAHFVVHGCVAADHGLEILRYADIPADSVLNAYVKQALSGETLDEQAIAAYQTALLVRLGRLYHRHQIVMQLHIGPIRNNNRRQFARLGVDSGFDSIGDSLLAQPLASLLDAMDAEDSLPKTILYTINPRDNEVLATMTGNFHQQGIRGKVQFGSGWWFNDQKDGMLRQLETHAQMGLLSVFVGMLTDSRSFLSYTRHEYFRRLLCNKIGQWVIDGEVPDDLTLLSELVENICYGNAACYFERASNDSNK